MKEYKKENINIAKVLRKNMTLWERKLWYEFLRNYPIRFQRQKAIGNYIVDFYCAKAKLVVVLNTYIEKGILDSLKAIKTFEEVLGCDLKRPD